MAYCAKMQCKLFGLRFLHYPGYLQHQKFAYRDRAAERRCLHGGIGIGPGHKDVMNNDDSSEDAKEAAAEAMELSFGSGSYGRRVLESMGWKEVCSFMVLQPSVFSLCKHIFKLEFRRTYLIAMRHWKNEGL